MSNSNLKLNTNWVLWFHNIKKNWKIDGYKKLIKFEYLHEFLIFINNYNYIKNLFNTQFFIMRENINPIWEDKENRDGGCISIKCINNNLIDTWNKLCLLIIGEDIVDSLDINGISLCIKNINYSIIQIWLKHKNNNIIDYIYNNFDKNIIFKSYDTEY